MSTILETAELVAREWGKPVLSPRWEATLRMLYGLELRESDIALLRTSTRRSEANLRELSATGKHAAELWCRVGRRGRKSLTAALVAVHEAVFGGHEKHMLPNERGIVAVVSKDSAGSQVVADFAELIANALGLKPKWSSVGSIAVLNLQGCALSIAVFPCNSKAPRGFAIPIVIADEIAHWQQDAATHVEADSTILTALRAPMAQFSQSKLIAISTPYGVLGEFHETTELNLTDAAGPRMLAVEGATFEWNPDIPEERAREIEKDPKRYTQEILAVPTDTISAAFELDDINAAFSEVPSDVPSEGRRFCVIDASSLKKDAFAFAIGCETRTGEIRFLEIGGWEGPDLAKATTLGIVDHIAYRCKMFGCERAFGDQRDASPIGDQFKKHSIVFTEYPYSAKSKDAAGQTLGKLLAERRLQLPANDRMRRELIGQKARLLPGGLYSYPTNGKDFISLLFTLCEAINVREVRSAVQPPQATIADVDHEQLSKATMAMMQAFGGEGFGYSTNPDRDDWLASAYGSIGAAQAAGVR